MTLWLPLLDYARSYAPLVQRTLRTIHPVQAGDCAHNFGLTAGQITAFRVHGTLPMKPAGDATGCRWLIVNRDIAGAMPATIDMSSWTLFAQQSHPTDGNDNFLIYQRQAAPKP